MFPNVGMFGSEHSYIFSSSKPVSLFVWGSEVYGHEKPELLGWDYSRIIKTVFFQGEEGLYGFVLPQNKKVDRKDIAETLGISKKKAARVKMSDVLPHKQVPGSCGPFICEKDLDLVEKIVFSSECFDREIDFSYPGRADLSLHMKYEDAISILRERYPEKIEVREMR